MSVCPLFRLRNDGFVKSALSGLCWACAGAPVLSWCSLGTNWLPISSVSFASWVSARKLPSREKRNGKGDGTTCALSAQWQHLAIHLSGRALALHMLAVKPKADKQLRPSFFHRSVQSDSPWQQHQSSLPFSPLCFASSLSTLFISAESSLFISAEYCLNCRAGW